MTTLNAKLDAANEQDKREGKTRTQKITERVLAPAAVLGVGVLIGNGFMNVVNGDKDATHASNLESSSEHVEDNLRVLSDATTAVMDVHIGKGVHLRTEPVVSNASDSSFDVDNDTNAHVLGENEDLYIPYALRVPGEKGDEGWIAFDYNPDGVQPKSIEEQADNLVYINLPLIQSQGGDASASNEMVAIRLEAQEDLLTVLPVDAVAGERGMVNGFTALDPHES